MCTRNFWVRRIQAGEALATGAVEALYHYATPRLTEGTPDYQSVLDRDLKELRSNDPDGERRSIPTTLFNCHGLAFASRRGWLSDPQMILNSGEFRELYAHEPIIAGDILLYRDQDEIDHSGIIVAVPTRKTSSTADLRNKKRGFLVISKWGANGEFLHDAILAPYPTQDLTVYRFCMTVY